jgi:SpoIID/LytB domain protein
LSPASAQHVQVRLCEICHPTHLEIELADRQFTTNGSLTHLPKARRDQNSSPSESAGRLMISAANDTVFCASGVRINLTGDNLQIQSDGFNHSLRLIDTLHIAATAAHFFMAVNAGRATLPVKNSARIEYRPYIGKLKIYAAGDELGVINLVPSEDYLAGVLATEMSQAQLAALQAQAIVSRTYIFKNWKRHQRRGYQFCDLTHCQVYKGNARITPLIRQAVSSTQGQILAIANQPLEVFYSSTCGGLTADDEGMWTNGNDQAYLRSVADSAFCADSPHFRWRTKIPIDNLHQIWQRCLGEPITSIAIAKKGADGRVRELALMGNSLHLISGEDFRTVTCRALGWSTLKSTVFDLRVEKSAYVFAGRGLGHGLGLCQYGAMAMARKGYSYRDILRLYFPGAEIRKYEKKF